MHFNDQRKGACPRPRARSGPVKEKDVVQPRILIALGAGLLAATPAMAHHSGAMFDHSKEVTLKGVIKTVQLTNPHSWFQVMVADDAGKTVEWSVEAQAPTVLVRGGINRASFKPGDAVTVRAHPLKDGRPGADLITITTAKGEVLPRRGGGGAYE
jgi:hypothetical protein